VLSLGSCISASVTVLSSRGAALQPVLFGAGQQRLVDRLPGRGANRRDRVVQHRFLRRPRQRQAGKGAKRGRILKMEGQLFVTQLALLLEQRTAQHAFRRQSPPSGLAHPLPPQIARNQTDQPALAIQPL
jgi:hypothetical protein